MDISLNTLGSKKNRTLPAPAFLPAAERREAERSEADQSGAAGKNVPNPPNPEVVADAKRRRFTMEYKLRILKEADAAKETAGGVGALLRREGLYSSHLTIWRQERDAAVRQALTPKARGPKPKLDPQREELQRLRRDNARLTAALSKAELIIDVQKKVGSLLGWNLPQTDPGENS
jgi:transposase